MKKNLLAIFAVVIAISLSAFSFENKKTNSYYWFEQVNHTYVGSTPTSANNPEGCSTLGSDCVKGYIRSSQPSSEPTSSPDAQFSNP